MTTIKDCSISGSFVDFGAWWRACPLFSLAARRSDATDGIAKGSAPLIDAGAVGQYVLSVVLFFEDIMRLLRRFLSPSSFVALWVGLLVSAFPASAQVQVAVIGDSNVYGKGVATSENYPSQLEAALKARGLSVSVSNGGVNGDTSAGLAARLDSAVPAGTRVAVIWIGINDVRRGVSRAEVLSNVAGIVSRLRARGIDSYFIKPPVYDVADHKNPALTIQGDGHFNAAGYRRMVSKTLGTVQSLVVKAKKKAA